ncbi:Uncharacterised protein [Klebsiella aerogenes]|nr:Uncharacterised protein [Klebsiella aerogenes]
MVLFTTRRVRCQRRDRRRDKLIQQHPTGSGPRIIPDNENDHQGKETADDLPQRTVEELTELKLHRVIQHQNVNGARQRSQRSETPFLHFDTDKERHRRQADAKQQHALLRRRHDHQEVQGTQR